MTRFVDSLRRRENEATDSHSIRRQSIPEDLAAALRERILSGPFHNCPPPDDANVGGVDLGLIDHRPDMGRPFWVVEPTAAWIAEQWRTRLACEATNCFSGVSIG